jgi:hypothetical protein
VAKPGQRKKKIQAVRTAMTDRKAARGDKKNGFMPGWRP